MKIIKHPEFTHTIKVKVPVDGGHKEESFKAKFRMLPVSKVTAVESATGDDDKVRAFLTEALIEAYDLESESGEMLPWSDEVRDYLIDMPHTRSALYIGYFTAFQIAKSGN